ncbi:glycosyltransferase [Paenarthrobacter aurescens]|uniref:Glycosyl transferase n=1 Tax=Paenarthrobacter aurescens TaxID=43663 RepID=A0A4Y3N791_PAEAU|nr:glycosyltransferase [Paenarthrobacter aurescens]MDO6144615.1 glycosyltransferase [Paenarthrobacter aurescens]MDO6148460.1 glycosyltransferase [Paenarthrobacter aurescens]MDO6159706.1 glycosyltransferase [Paenarthrobacter aurescens]MDO6164608.1 glycosyltransferase [Paenarthrobacter aurescens]GEB17724.1 glycosyl transferase [Paenarthrobacter aurescens]
MRRSHVDLEVIIPAYNEAARISNTLTQTVDFLAVQPWTSRIVVVDNGSVDDTAAVVHRISREKGDAVPISLVGCSRRGKGAAVRRGLLSGTSKYTGFFDADLATPLETLTETMSRLAGGAAAVIASRHAPGSTFVVPQHIGRRMGGTAFRVLTKSKVKGIQDTQCGFKFFERDALTAAMVQCRSTGFAFDVELLLRLQDNHASIVELPVAWTDGAESTFRPFQDGVASFASVIQLQKAAS